MQRLRNTRCKEGFGDYAKKNTLQYEERNEQRRGEFIEELEALPEDSELFYVDESGFDEYYSREYGYAPRGEKVIGKVSGRHFARTSIVAAIKATQLETEEVKKSTQASKIVAAFAYKGSMSGDLFEGWLEDVFVPTLKKPEKSALILDNATFHRKEAIQEIADEYGFRVIFLPPYSPDLNPIEKFWANVKRRLRLHVYMFKTFWDALYHAFK